MKAPALGSFLSKVLALLQTPTQMFSEKSAKILRTHFLNKRSTNTATSLSRLLGWVKVIKITKRSS